MIIIDNFNLVSTLYGHEESVDTIRRVYAMISNCVGEQGIIARKYFYPLTNAFECYRDYPTAGPEKTPVANHIAQRVLTLPLYADLSLTDVDRICDIILEK